MKSFPFSSSTDFGGADLLPPIRGVATFGNDFGVLFARPHSVEVWRIDAVGNRKSGVLVLPSLAGDIGAVSSVSSASLLTSSYADYTGSGRGAAAGHRRGLLLALFVAGPWNKLNGHPRF